MRHWCDIYPILFYICSLSNAESYILTACKVVDYLHRSVSVLLSCLPVDSVMILSTVYTCGNLQKCLYGEYIFDS